MKEKILIIGGGMPGKAILHLLEKEFPDTVIISAEEAKEEIENPFQKEPIELIRAPRLKDEIYFPEPKNFINGKKLPKKRRK